MPRPKAGFCLRTSIIRRVQCSSDVELAQLRLDVGDLVAVDRVHDHRQEQLARVARREPGVAVGRPLHRRPDAVAVTEPDVVAHADLVAVVEDRRAGQGQQQRGEQLELVAVVVEQRRQPAADADVGLHAGVLGVLAPHVVALLVGDHLEGQLVVVAQEDAPLAVVGDRRRLRHDLRDRVARLPADAHEQPRHHREVEGHLALVAVLRRSTRRRRAGHWLASQSMTRSGYCASTSLRTRLRNSWVAGRFSQLVPSSSNR